MLHIAKKLLQNSINLIGLSCMLWATVFSSSIIALTGDDIQSLIGQYPYYDPNANGDNNINCQSGGDGSIDRLLQAIAQHESGGNPNAYNPGGPAYGKYQMLPGTWQGRAKAYDNAAGLTVASTFATPPTVPPSSNEAIQDGVEYIEFLKESIKWNGSVFRIAVDQYWPIANTDYSQLDIVPYPDAGNTETVREFANQMVDWYNNGDGSSIKLYYSQAPGFEQALSSSGQPKALWAQDVPKPSPPPDASQTGPSTSTSSPSCNAGVIATIEQYAWPDFNGTDSLDPSTGLHVKAKPEYTTALQQPGAYQGDTSVALGADCGAFVTAVMRGSGADTSYNSGNGPTSEQQQYMVDHPNMYQFLGTSSNNDFVNNLQPGDIAVTPNHTYIYVGTAISGWGGNSASASQNTRTGMADNFYPVDSKGVPFSWYRLK